MIELKGLCKSFEEKEVLKDINATFENGKTNLIIGQSGSGKTVLMKCIVGLLTPDKGELLYDHRNFLAMGKKEKKALRREMGMIFQSAALFDSMTVLDNVMFPLNMFSNDTLRDRTRRAMFCLERVKLIEAKDKFPGEISGGMQKRVAIARALATDPEIIYFDEPTSALAPELTGEVLSVMRQLAEEGMTMLVVTHEMGFARNVSSKTVFMENGVVVEQAPSHEFFANPKEERTREFLRKIAHTE